MQVVGLYFVCITNDEYDRVRGTKEQLRMEQNSIPCNMCSIEEAHPHFLDMLENTDIKCFNGMFVENDQGRYLCFDKKEIVGMRGLKIFEEKIKKKWIESFKD